MTRISEMDFDILFPRICSDLEKDGKVKEISTQFSACANDSQRVAFALNLAGPRLTEQLDDILTRRISAPSKSQEVAISFREDGNTLYRKKSNLKALSSYNLSAMMATGEHLALAYANRSAVLHDEGDWLHCLRDIRLALDTGCYPPHLEHKLHERQGNCWLKLAEKSLAMDSFTRAIHCPSIPQDKVSIISSKMGHQLSSNGLMGALEQPSVESIERLIFARLRPVPPELNRPRNPLLPCASASVRLAETAERGRCLVATEALEPGGGERASIDITHVIILTSSPWAIGEPPM